MFGEGSRVCSELLDLDDDARNENTGTKNDQMVTSDLRLVFVNGYITLLYTFGSV